MKRNQHRIRKICLTVVLFFVWAAMALVSVGLAGCNGNNIEVAKECPVESPESGDPCEGYLSCSYNEPPLDSCWGRCGPIYFLTCICKDEQFDCGYNHLDCYCEPDGGWYGDRDSEGGEGDAS